MSRRCDVATSQRRDIVGKTQQTLSLGEAIKGTEESGRNWSLEQRKEDLKADLKERDLKNPGDRHSLDH